MLHLRNLCVPLAALLLRVVRVEVGPGSKRWPPRLCQLYMHFRGRKVLGPGMAVSCTPSPDTNHPAANARSRTLLQPDVCSSPGKHGCQLSVKLGLSYHTRRWESRRVISNGRHKHTLRCSIDNSSSSEPRVRN